MRNVNWGPNMHPDKVIFLIIDVRISEVPLFYSQNEVLNEVFIMSSIIVKNVI